MARSGSVNFTLNRSQIIQAAFEIIGIAIDGEALSSSDEDVANRALNMMIKAWQAYDLTLWKREELTITLVASQATYTIGRSGTPDKTADRPIKVLEAKLNDSSNNTVYLNSIGDSDLFRLTTSTGVPTLYNYSPTLDNGTLTLWPTPTSTEASEYTVIVYVQSPLEDMDSGVDDVDFPQEWLEAITTNLAYRLSSRYPMNPVDRGFLKKDAKDTLELALGFDVEESVYFQPNRD